MGLWDVIKNIAGTVYNVGMQQMEQAEKKVNREIDQRERKIRSLESRDDLSDAQRERLEEEKEKIEAVRDKLGR